jgi:hypothetical protein
LLYRRASADRARGFASCVAVAPPAVATGEYEPSTSLYPKAVVSDPSTAPRWQPSSCQPISRHRRIAAQLPTPPDRRPTRRCAASQEHSRPRERAVGEGGFHLGRVHSNAIFFSSTGVSDASRPNARSTLEVAFSAVPTQTSDERCSQQGSSRQGFDGKLSTKCAFCPKVQAGIETLTFSGGWAI